MLPSDAPALLIEASVGPDSEDAAVSWYDSLTVGRSEMAGEISADLQGDADGVPCCSSECR